MNEFTLHVIDESEFSAMGNEWNALLSSTLNNSVFLTWEWLFSWWQHFKMPNYSLAVVCARDSNSWKLKGILPLYHERNRQQRRGGTLHFLGTGEACSDFLDIIVEEGHEEEIVPRLLKYSLDRWRSSIWSLTDIPLGSKNLVLLESVLQDRRIPYSMKDGEICPFLELPDTLESFMKKLKPNMRSNYNKKIKKIDKHSGKIRLVVESPDDFQANIDTLFLLHRSRFKMKGETSRFLTERMRKLHLAVGRMFSEQGWLRFYTIKTEKMAIGSLYCFIYGGRTYYYQGGFDPKYDSLSIGLILLGKGMEDSIENGIKTFEFLRGAEAYKWNWTSTYRKTVRFSIYPKSLLGSTKCRYDRFKRETLNNLKVMVGRKINGSIDDKQHINFS